MFDFFLSKIFGTKHDRLAKKLMPFVDAINKREQEYQSLSKDRKSVV